MLNMKELHKPVVPERPAPPVGDPISREDFKRLTGKLTLEDVCPKFKEELIEVHNDGHVCLVEGCKNQHTFWVVKYKRVSMGKAIPKGRKEILERVSKNKP
jgi:hypothetical protein